MMSNNPKLALIIGIELYFLICHGTACFCQQNIWKEKPPMSICRAFHSMAVCGGNIYVMGGSTGKKSEFRDTASVEMYNPKTEKWENRCPMPSAITTSCAVAVDNKIFIVGGQENVFDTRIKKVLMYDCESDKWHLKSPMKIARAFHCLATLNDKLYVIGGREKPEEIKFKSKDSLAVYTIEEYDISSDKWQIKTILPFKHFPIGTVTLNNRIYILSDSLSHSNLDKSAVFEEYNPELNTFKRLALLSPSRCDAAMVSSNGKIYVFGGWNYGSISLVDEYDPVLGKWEKKTDMPFPVQNHQVISIDDKIFITGGIIYPKDGNEKMNNLLEYHPKND